VQVWKADSLFLLFEKDLRPSDVGSLGRIVLPKVRDSSLLKFVALSWIDIFSWGRFSFGSSVLWYRRSLKLIYRISHPKMGFLFPWTTLTLAWLGVSDTGEHLPSNSALTYGSCLCFQTVNSVSYGWVDAVASICEEEDLETCLVGYLKSILIANF
jgi:hypothetical protein